MKMKIRKLFNNDSYIRRTYFLFQIFLPRRRVMHLPFKIGIVFHFTKMQPTEHMYFINHRLCIPSRNLGRNIDYFFKQYLFGLLEKSKL